MKLKINNSLKKLIRIVLIIAVTSFVFLEGMIIVKGNVKSDVSTDIVIILGGGLKGETPSLSLLERLKAGLEYLERNPDAKAVVSGGQGRGEAITEAEAMKRYLLQNGIAGDRIIVEDQSTSTMENFMFTKPVVEAAVGHEVKKITVITNNFHMLRALMLAERNGFEAYGISSPTPFQVAIQSYVREYFALIKSFLLDRP